jgi:hypothetical protein
VHLVYEAKDPWPLVVRYGWSDQEGEHVAEHTYRQVGDVDSSWVVPTGKGAVTKWVEFVPAKAGPPASQP